MSRVHGFNFLIVWMTCPSGPVHGILTEIVSCPAHAHDICCDFHRLRCRVKRESLSGLEQFVSQAHMNAVHDAVKTRTVWLIKFALLRCWTIQHPQRQCHFKQLRSVSSWGTIAPRSNCVCSCLFGRPPSKARCSTPEINPRSTLYGSSQVASACINTSHGHGGSEQANATVAEMDAATDLTYACVSLQNFSWADSLQGEGHGTTFRPPLLSSPKKSIFTRTFAAELKFVPAFGVGRRFSVQHRQPRRFRV